MQKTILEKAISIGCYSPPFKENSTRMNAVIDKNITYEIFLSNLKNWYAQETKGKSYKYTELEMQAGWRVIIEQRMYLEAAILVYEKKEISYINAISKIKTSNILAKVMR